MTSTVGLELTPDLTWKTVPKRNRSGTRRTRKPVAKSLTMGIGLADKNAINLENVTFSESEKLGVDILGRHFSEKVENVPIKKRRFTFLSPSPPFSLAPYPHLEASEQHVDVQNAPDQNLGSSAVQWKPLMKFDSYDSSIDDEKVSEVIDGVKDFSGIEMLAAAACNDRICNDVTEYEENPSVEESTQERIQSSTSSTHLEETTMSQETASCFSKDSANEIKSEGSSFQGNSLAVLHRFPSDEDTTPSLPLHEFCSGKRTELSVNESKSEDSSFQDNSFGVLHEFPNDKNTTAEMPVPLPDDRLLWDLNVPMDAWPCGGGNFDSQKDCFDDISVGSEELQTKEPQDIKNDSTNVLVSSDVDGGSRMTTDLRIMPVETADSSKGKQEFGDDSQNIKNRTVNEVVSSDVEANNKMTSDLKIMPAGTAELNTEKQESGDGSQNIKDDTTIEVVSLDVEANNKMTSDLRTMPVRTDDLSTEKHFSGDGSKSIKNDTANEVVSSDVDGGSRMTSDLRTMAVGTSDLRTMLVGTDDLSRVKYESGDGSQNIKDDTTIEVVSLDVEANNKMTSDLRTMPVGTDDLSTEKHVSGDGSKSIKNDTANDVVSSDVDGGSRMTSDLRTMPVGSDDFSREKHESGGGSQNIKDDTTIEVVSLDVEANNKMTSDLRTMPVGTDDLSTEKHESGNGSQNIKDDTTIEVVPLDVEAKNKMTSDLRTMPVGTDNLTSEKQENEGCSGYDSQFEDGELRESDFQYWEEAEQVDYDTDFEEERSFGLETESAELKVERGSNQELPESFKSSETGLASRKNLASFKISTVEVSEAETMKIDYLDGSDYDLRVDLSKESQKDLLDCVEGSLSSDVVQKSSFDNSNSSYYRAERCVGSDKFMGSDRSSHMRGRSPAGSHFFNTSSNHWDSKRSHPSIYHGPYNFGRPRPKSDFENREYPMGTYQFHLEAGGGARPDYRIHKQFMGSYRPLLRMRSPIERDDSYNMQTRMPTVRDTSPDRNRFRRYPQGVIRGIKDEYLRHIPDDSAQYMNRMPHRLDRRERSISPHGGRPHHTVPYKRAQSRSRSRSPVDWLLQRDRNKGTRRRNRSPDFRSDARMDRVRLPFVKRFAAGNGEFGSPPRGRVSPQRNSRMFEDRNPGSDHFRGRKTHGRMFRQDQRFDHERPIRRLNSNDNFNPMIRPRRFPDRTGGGKGC